MSPIVISAEAGVVFNRTARRRGPGPFFSPRPGSWVAVALIIWVLLAARAPLASAAIPADPPRQLTRAAESVTWSGFSPTGWVTSAPFVSTVTATATEELQPSVDVYSISADGCSTWGGWLAAGLSTSIPVSTTHNISVSNLNLPDSASRNCIRFRVTGMSGEESISPFYLVPVDATAPAAPQNLAAQPATWSNAASFSVSWTNPPDVAGIAGAWYKLDSAPTSPTDGMFVAGATSISGITPGEPGSDDGAHPIYVWLEDTFGRANPASASSTTLYWDMTAPEPPTWMSASPAQQWTNVNSFSESWRNPNDISGIVGAYYKLNVLPKSPTDGTFIQTANTISNIRVPYDGRHSIYVWLVDGAGNVDHKARTGDPNVFWYDGTLPVSSSIVTPTLPATGWYTGTMNMSFSATDVPVDTAYPPVVDYQLDGAAWALAPPVLTISTEGSHQVRYRARDKADNLELAKTFSFGIDKTPPVATLEAARLPNAAGWYTSIVTHTLTVMDAVSGSPTGHFRLNDGPWQVGPVGVPITFALIADGVFRIEYYGQDAARNQSKPGVVEARIDMTPPTTGYTVEGDAGENGWYVSNLTVQLLPADNVSGVATTRYRINGGTWQTGTQFPLIGDGAYEVSYYSTDVAGNIGATQVLELKIDTAAPAAPENLSATPGGWTRTNSFDVQWANPTGTSGVVGAYYKLGALSGAGAPTGPHDGAQVFQTQHIDDLQVPGEGAYRLYVWLRDAAGNANHMTAPGMVPPSTSPVLRYDATAPVTNVEVQGEAGNAGWWLSPITVTLTATDGASGVAALRYRVDGGMWQITNQSFAAVEIKQPDKHVLEYYAEDVAGNVESPRQYTVRLDFATPASPASVQVLPAGWTRFNSFHFEWPLLNDLSGIGGAYVKFGSAPTAGDDGVFYAGTTEINGVTAPGEGRHTAYLWLEDGAGNADFRTAVAINDSVWYDGTPPVTDITRTGTFGANGWYVGPVTFEMSASDVTSGLLGIHYQIDDGEVQTVAPDEPGAATAIASSIVLSSDGIHTVRIWAEDQAGNLEPAHVFETPIDQTPPVANFTGPRAPVTRTQFDVSWTGNDLHNGSGLATYDIQVRDGYEGAWQAWLANTQLKAAQFTGQRAHNYFFRVYSQDRAGNQQTHPGQWNVLVQPVLNGSFDTGTFAQWTASGELFSKVAPTPGPKGVSILAAELGSEIYGPSFPPAQDVPAGCAAITQTITIPDLSQVRRPSLHFWYRVKSYDVMFSKWYGKFVDTLDVTFAEAGQEPALLFRTGNPATQITNPQPPLYDSGWQVANLNLEPYAGRQGELSFANCNGSYPTASLNTWSYVDGIQIYDQMPVYMPLIIGAGGSEAIGNATGAIEPAGETEPIR